MPLAGMDPTSQRLREERERLNADENRAFRMLSEGELFYVDTDVSEDQLSASRHDVFGIGHLGGVSLEEIRRSMEDQNHGQSPGVLKPTSSLADTEAASRSTSQDSSDTGDTWQQQPMLPQHPLKQQQSHFVGSKSTTTDNNTTNTTTSIAFRQHENQDVHQQHLQAAKEGKNERSGRERSFSEPHHLSSCARRFVTHLPPKFPPVSCSTIPQTLVPRRRASMASAPDVREIRDGGFGVLQKSLSCIIGEPKVDVMRRHLTSSTSQKTFEISASNGEQDALARFCVVPDSWTEPDERGSMTFTMHIAGYRVMSTILGRHAEFEVRVKGGGRSWSRWQRFSKFKLMVQCVNKDRASMRAWRRVLRAQPNYRCLDENYLLMKCNLLEEFLQQVMFAMPTPALLIHFVNEK